MSDRLRASASATPDSVTGLFRRSVYDMQFQLVPSESSRIETLLGLVGKERRRRWKGNNKVKQQRLQRK